MYDSNASAAGLQVAEYMEEMQEDSEENYNKHFSQYMAAEVEGGDLEELMAKVMLHLF
jgi:thiaminase